MDQAHSMINLAILFFQVLRYECYAFWLYLSSPSGLSSSHFCTEVGFAAFFLP